MSLRSGDHDGRRGPAQGDPRSRIDERQPGLVADVDPGADRAEGESVPGVLRLKDAITPDTAIPSPTSFSRIRAAPPRSPLPVPRFATSATPESPPVLRAIPAHGE